MRVALAQINTTVGDINGNTEKIISAVKKTKADIIAFPELTITGYIPQDLLLRQDFIDRNLQALREVVRRTKNKTVILGFVEKTERGMHNSAAIIRNEQLVEIHRKIRLPNYAVFDEKRWFRKGSEPTVFEHEGKRIGVSICEDIWFPEITKRQKEKGAQLIINLSASPYAKGKFKTIEGVMSQRWQENRLPIICVNLVGSQDGVVFYGHSMHFDNAKIMKKCRDFEEDMVVVDIK